MIIIWLLHFFSIHKPLKCLFNDIYPVLQGVLQSFKENDIIHAGNNTKSACLSEIKSQMFLFLYYPCLLDKMS